MTVHYECEFEVSHPSMSAEYVRGIIDATIRNAQLAKQATFISKAAKIETIS